jgi:hypothetical protein
MPPRRPNGIHITLRFHPQRIRYWRVYRDISPVTAIDFIIIHRRGSGPYPNFSSLRSGTAISSGRSALDGRPLRRTRRAFIRSPRTICSSTRRSIVPAPIYYALGYVGHHAALGNDRQAPPAPLKFSGRVAADGAIVLTYMPRDRHLETWCDSARPTTLYQLETSISE